MDMIVSSFSLVQRLRLLLWAMLLLPILAGVAFFLLHSSHTLQNEAVRDLNTTLHLEQQFIERWVDEREGNLAVLAADPRLLSLPPQALAAMLQKLLVLSPFFTDIVVVDAAGHARAGSRPASGLDLSDREYFKAAQRGRGSVSDVLESRLSGDSIFVVSAPVKDARGEFQGLVLGTVSLTTLSALMQTVQEASSSRTFLMQADGALLAPAKQGRGLRRGDVLFDRALADAPSQGIYRNAAGVRVVGTYQWILGGRWLLAAERPETAILAMHAWVLGVPLLGAALVFLIFGPMALRLGGSLRAPLLRLESHARQIEAGNFEVDCGLLPDANAPEEVRRLNQAYCLMVDRVRGAMEDLRQSSLTDHLTGAANRKRLFQEGARLVEATRRGGQSISLLMLDLDHFKQVNDTFGHGAGDVVLAGFAELVQGLLRKSDLFARFGGEEFVVLAPNAGRAASGDLAQRIRQAVELLALPVGEKGLHVSVSIGVTTLEAEAWTVSPSGVVAGREPLEALLARADEALYVAKGAGRNRVVFLPLDSAPV